MAVQGGQLIKIRLNFSSFVKHFNRPGKGRTDAFKCSQIKRTEEGGKFGCSLSGPLDICYGTAEEALMGPARSVCNKEHTDKFPGPFPPHFPLTAAERMSGRRDSSGFLIRRHRGVKR